MQQTGALSLLVVRGGPLLLCYTLCVMITLSAYVGTTALLFNCFSVEICGRHCLVWLFYWMDSFRDLRDESIQKGNTVLMLPTD